jgi:uncharacterized protein YbjT (DUF2867 family)
MSPIKKIAIIGATGMLGIPVTVALIDAGFEVTALARRPDEAKRVLPAAARVVAADVRDETSLRRGLAGQDGLYLNLSVAPNERRADFHTEQQGLDHILAAARAADIRRVGYLSALVHDSPSRWWVLELWRNAVARIKGSGIPYTIFYPSNFMETLPQRHMMGRTFVMTGWSRNRNWWIAGADFGRQVARSFAIPEAANREYVVQGPEPMTYNDAARRFARAASTKTPRLTLPLLFIHVAGVASPPMRFNGRIMRTVLRYPETFKAADTWRELGKPAITIEEFARAL